MKSRLIFHESAKNLGMSGNVWECSACGGTWGDEDSCRKHIHAVHPENIRYEEEEVILPLTECDPRNPPTQQSEQTAKVQSQCEKCSSNDSSEIEKESSELKMDPEVVAKREKEAAEKLKIEEEEKKMESDRLKRLEEEARLKAEAAKSQEEANSEEVKSEENDKP